MGLERDASVVLRATVTESVILLPVGFSKEARRNTAGGGLIGLLVDRGLHWSDAAPTEQLAHEGGAFLTSSAAGVVLFAVTQGKLRQKLADPIWRIAPGDIADVRVGKAAPGMVSLAIRARTGALYVFELTRMKLGAVRSIIESVGARIAEPG